MSSLNKLEDRVVKIEERNKRVEIDKSWETSHTRKIFIAICTYLAIGLYMNAISLRQAWLNAIIPTVGFLLSTLTVPFIKKFWKKYIHRK